MENPEVFLNDNIAIDINNYEDDSENLELDTEEKNDISIEELNMIRNSIENMSKFNQVEILRILNQDKNIILNENKYGIHINLSSLKNDIIEKLKNFINYVQNQELTLNQVEKQKENYKNIYFTKDNKDNLKNNDSKDVKKSKLQY
jgi:hypothetical protein